MKVKTNLKSGPLTGCHNHNQSVARGLKLGHGVKTGEGKARPIFFERNCTNAQALKVRSGVKAGMAAPIKEWIEAS